MKKAFIWVATAFSLGCSGSDVGGGSSAVQVDTGGAGQVDAGGAGQLDAGGAGNQPAFCGYATELRELPTDGCNFAGVCKLKVAIYCYDADAATRKKYDCECVQGAYTCTATEYGLSIDATCFAGQGGM